MFQVPRRIGSVLSRLLRRDHVCSGEEREAELHLYAVSSASRLYLHLQSSWNSFIIVSEDRKGWRFTSLIFHFKYMQTFSNSSQMYNFMIIISIQYVLSVFFFFGKIYNAYITHNAVTCEKLK